MVISLRDICLKGESDCVLCKWLGQVQTWGETAPGFSWTRLYFCTSWSPRWLYMYLILPVKSLPHSYVIFSSLSAVLSYFKSEPYKTKQGWGFFNFLFVVDCCVVFEWVFWWYLVWVVLGLVHSFVWLLFSWFISADGLVYTVVR